VELIQRRELLSTKNPLAIFKAHHLEADDDFIVQRGRGDFSRLPHLASGRLKPDSADHIVQK